MSRYGPVPRSISRRVEPSISENRQVTVPVGGPDMAAPRAVMSVPAGFGERPKTSGQPPQQREADRRLLVDDGLEVPGREREAGGLPLGEHLGDARQAVEDRQLAEEVAWAECRDRLTVANDPCAAASDHEEPGAHLALAGDDVAVGEGDLHGPVRDPI